MSTKETRNWGSDGLRLIVAGCILWVGFGEYTYRNPIVEHPGLLGDFYQLLQGASARYATQRAWVTAHPWLDGLGVLAASLICLLCRYIYLYWHNVVLSKLRGTDLSGTNHEVRQHRFELLDELRKTPPGFYFLGLGAERQPIYVSELDRNAHMQITGGTGTGKSASNVNPLTFQDMLAGKGAVTLEGKGQLANLLLFKAMAAVANRAKDVRVFSLEHPESSNTYNVLHMGPNTDPLKTAERVFADLPLEESYYKNEARAFFGNVVRLMADTGKPFNLVDVRIAVSNPDAMHHLFELSSDRRAKYEINTQVALLGKEYLKAFTGLRTALSFYDPGGVLSERLNSYNPDIILEDVVNKRQLVYLDLPVNRWDFLAPSLGRVFLRHLAFVGADRDSHPENYDATAFSVKVDEADVFMSEQMLNALTKLRSAQMQFLLAHQDHGQLRAISESFETTMHENTRLKIQYQTLDAKRIEAIAKSYGTRTTYKKTVRFSPGPLFTHINTGEASTREVQEFVVHPDALKSLAPVGHAFFMRPSGVEPISFATLPPMSAGNYQTVRKPSVEGLNFIGKFVDARGVDNAEMSQESAAA